MNFCTLRNWLEKTDTIWPPKDAKWIESNEIQEFLTSYNHYRQGHWKGAKGDLEGVVRDIALLRNRKNITEVANDSLPDTQFLKASIFETAEDPVAIHQLHQLDQYRQAYRRFRTGSDRGAQGEISKLAETFTRDQLRLLPVAALAQYLEYRTKGSTSLDLVTPRFHLHFGAGKLGLGLILPSLVSQAVPFALCQRVSDEWVFISQQSNSTLDVLINNTFLTQLTVIRSLKDLQRLNLLEGVHELPAVKDLNAFHLNCFCESLARNDDPLKKRLLVLSEELESFFTRAADSYSCSLGPALRSCIKCLGSTLRRERFHTDVIPPLYGCENDHTALAEFKQEFQAYLSIQECMVDRICSQRVITHDKILVTAEPYAGEIVVSPRTNSNVACALGGSSVLVSKTYGAYSYLYNRKFFIVNGTHTTFAFMTLRRYCTYSADAPGDFTLISYNEMTPLERLELKAWTVARCLLIFHNHDMNVIKYTHSLSSDQDVIECLWKYAERMTQRLASVEDSTKRVLGGGVANRYKTRLCDVLETLETFHKSLPYATELFSLSGIPSIEKLIEILKILVIQTERFVTLRPLRGPPYDNEAVMDQTSHKLTSTTDKRLTNTIKGYYRQFSPRRQR